MVTSEVCRVGFWCTDFGKNPSVRYRKCVVTRIDSDRGFSCVLDLSYALVKSRHGNDGIEVLGSSGDGDELVPASVELGGGGEAHRHQLGGLSKDLVCLGF